jgi:hypothetical protein
MPFLHIPRILQVPTHRACKQNCAKRDPNGAPLIAREILCSPLANAATCDPDGGKITVRNLQPKWVLNSFQLHLNPVYFPSNNAPLI